MKSEAGGKTWRSVKLAAAIMVVYFFHAPLAYIALQKFHPAAPLLLLVLLPLVVFFHQRLSVAKPRLGKVLSILYYTGIAASQVVPLYFLSLISPFWFPLPFAMAACAFCLPKLGRIGGASFFLILTLAVLSQTVTVGKSVALLSAIPLLLWVVLSFEGSIKRLPRIAFSFATLGLLVSVCLVTFLAGVPFHSAARISSQSGVKVLAVPGDLGIERGWKVERTEIRFAAMSCDGSELLLGTRGSVTGLYALSPDTGNLRTLPLPGDISDNMAADCRNDKLYVGSYEAGEAYEVEESSFRILRNLPFPNEFVGIFRLAADSGLLYMIPDDSPNVILIDTKTFTAIGRTDDRQANSAMILDEGADRIVRITNAGRVILRDRFSLEKLREKRVSGQLYFNVALVDKRDELVVDCMSTGRLFALDRNTLATKRKGRNNKGFRFLHYDEKRDLLFAGNFFTGHVVALDPMTFEERKRVYVGPRPRWLEATSDGDRLLVASGTGAIEIFLPALLNE